MSGGSVISESIFSLSKMGLQNLQHEPQRLTLEAARLNSELELLVMDNYRIFVENLSCSVQLRAEDRLLEDVRGELKVDLKKLGDTCKQFRENVASIIASHKRNRKTLQHHMQLVELLEVPQLVDACARNGFYDEALELANFVNGLERRHLLASEVQVTRNGGPNEADSVGTKRRGGSNVVQSIVNDVYKTLLSLRSQLLQLLTDDSSLPQELQILGTLRKLDSLVIDRQLSLERYNNEKFAAMTDAMREDIRRHLLREAETKLQMSFLEARSIWLKKLFERSTSSHITAHNSHNTLDTHTNVGDSPYGKAIEMLEVNRTAWFSIITQYNALFSDHIEGNIVSCVGAHPSDAILNAWITRQVSKLSRVLKVLLPQIEDGGSIRSILEQTMFFSSRMREVGGDFSGLALPIFNDALVHRVVHEWRNAVEQFKRIVATEKILIETDDYSREQVIPLYLSQDAAFDEHMNMTSAAPKKTYEDIVAPSALLAFPPLAYLLNSILTGLNILRECPMPTVKSELVLELDSIVREIATFLIHSANQLVAKGAKYFSVNGNPAPGASNSKNQATAPTQTPLDKMYATSFCLDFLPHVLLCFETLFPHAISQSSHGRGSMEKTADISGVFHGTVKIKRGTEHREMIGRDLFSIQQTLLDTLIDADLLSKELKYSHSQSLIREQQQQQIQQQALLLQQQQQQQEAFLQQQNQQKESEKAKSADKVNELNESNPATVDSDNIISEANPQVSEQVPIESVEPMQKQENSMPDKNSEAVWGDDNDAIDHMLEFDKE